MQIRVVLRQFVAAGLFTVVAGILTSGCALLALPAVEEMGTLFGPTASGASGVVSAESSVTVNNSWVKNNDAQARYYHDQRLALSRERQQKLTRRAASVGILKSMAALDNDPQLADLARWVEAGGDPQFALSYGLAKDKDDAARRRAVRILEDMSEQGNDPVLYDLARWVRAGGDEKFALNYALRHGAKSEAADQTRNPPELSQGGRP
jgi:hypothetical protein